MTGDAQQPQALGEVIRKARVRLGYSFRDVERHSDGTVGASTVHRLEKGVRSGAEPRTLQGLSAALHVPLEDLRRANGQTVRVPLERFVVPDRFNNLTAKQRKLLISVGDALLEAGQR